MKKEKIFLAIGVLTGMLLTVLCCCGFFWNRASISDFEGTYLCDVSEVEESMNPQELTLSFNDDGNLMRTDALYYGTTGTTTFRDYTEYKIKGSTLTCKYDGEYSIYGPLADSEGGTDKYVLNEDGNLESDGHIWYRTTSETSSQTTESGTLMEVTETDFPDGKFSKKAPFLGNTRLQRRDVEQITFLSSLEGKPDDAWDVSANQDGSVYAWVDQSEGVFCVYIAAEGGVTANSRSNNLFRCCVNLKSIDFNDSFHVTYTATMAYMFAECNSLTSLDMTDFMETSSGNMKKMFYDCFSLTELNLTESMFADGDLGNFTDMFTGTKWEGSSPLLEDDSVNLTVTYLLDTRSIINNNTALSARLYQAYDDKISEIMEDVENTDNKMYAISDLDGDSIPELIVRTASGDLGYFYSMFTFCVESCRAQYFYISDKEIEEKDLHYRYVMPEYIFSQQSDIDGDGEEERIDIDILRDEEDVDFLKIYVDSVSAYSMDVEGTTWDGTEIDAQAYSVENENGFLYLRIYSDEKGEYCGLLKYESGRFSEILSYAGLIDSSQWKEDEQTGYFEVETEYKQNSNLQLNFTLDSIMVGEDFSFTSEYNYQNGDCVQNGSLAEINELQFSAYTLADSCTFSRYPGSEETSFSLEKGQMVYPDRVWLANGYLWMHVKNEEGQEGWLPMCTASFVEVSYSAESAKKAEQNAQNLDEYRNLGELSGEDLRNFGDDKYDEGEYESALIYYQYAQTLNEDLDGIEEDIEKTEAAINGETAADAGETVADAGETDNTEEQGEELGQGLAVSAQCEEYYEGDDAYLLITGVNEAGETCWRVQTNTYEEIGDFATVYGFEQYGDRYYYYEDGNIIALNVADGSRIWGTDVDAYGLSVFTVDENNNVYTSGFYSPGLLVLDQNGTIKLRIDSFEPNYYWPTAIEYRDGQVRVTFCAGGTDSSFSMTSTSEHNNKVTFVVNPEDGSYTPIYFPDLGETTEGEAYRQFMQNAYYSEDVLLWDNTWYAVTDLNGDGILELILSGEQEGVRDYRICYYEEAQVKQMEEGTDSYDFTELDYTYFEPASLVTLEPNGSAVTASLETFYTKSDEDLYEYGSDETYEKTYEYGLVTGWDAEGQKVWVYRTDYYSAAQLSAVREIGISGGRYYFTEVSTLMALSLSNGEKIWSCSDCVVGDGTVTENGTAYLCGYLEGPNFLEVSPDGEIVYQIEEIAEGYYWPYGITYLGDRVSVTFEGYPEGGDPETTFYVYLNDYHVEMAGTDSTSEDQSGNQDGQVSEEASSLSLEEKIENIRTVYYGTQENLASYTLETDGVGREYYRENGELRKIVAYAGTYTDASYGDISRFASEFYYDGGELKFVFVFDGSEEYRYYIDTMGGEAKCIRYIDSAGTIYDYEEGLSIDSGFSGTSCFCVFANAYAENASSENASSEQTAETVSAGGLSMYEQYRDIVAQKEAEFGTVEVVYDDYETGYLAGVCFLDLLDFDGDGTEELLLYYKDKQSDSNDRYQFLIYRYDADAGTVNEVFSAEGTSESNGGWRTVSIYEIEGKPCVFADIWETDDIRRILYGAVDGGFGTVEEIRSVTEWNENNLPQSSYYKDNMEITADEFSAEQSTWFAYSEESYILRPVGAQTQDGEFIENNIAKVNEVRQELGL